MQGTFSVTPNMHRNALDYMLDSTTYPNVATLLESGDTITSYSLDDPLYSGTIDGRDVHVYFGMASMDVSNIALDQVPEPATMIMLAAGLPLLLKRRRSRS